jgi:hypothetical protein
MAMPMVHIVSRSFRDPRFAEPTVNRNRVYEPDPQKAVAAVLASAAPLWASDEEYRLVQRAAHG